MRTQNKMKRTPAKAGTKKISFLKLLLMDIRERNWLLALIGAVAAVTYPIGTLIVLENTNPLRIAETAETFLGITGSYYCIFLLVAALLAGVSGFMYLERQDKADFFMSFPVRREIFFFVPYISGWLISVVPYVFFMLLALFPVCGLRGCLTASLIKTVFRAMAFNIFAFTAIYSVVVLAMVLTGRMLIGVLLSGCFLFYGSCAYGLITILKDMFFETWYSMDRGMGFLQYSPVTAMVYFEDMPTKAVFLELLWLLAALLAAVLIYVKRPAETAENAFTFSRMAPVLKTVLSIPIGLGFGLLACAITNGNSRTGWFLFGSAAAAFIANGVIEFIIAPDLKNVARHWISGTVILAGTVGLAAVFAFDLTGYDSWYPDKEDVQSMAVSENFVTEGFGEFASLTGYYNINTGNGYLTNISAEPVYLKRNLVENFDGIYKLAGIGVETTRNRANEPRFLQTAVLYKMKSGRLVYRTYRVRADGIDEAVREMSEETEFRKHYYPFGQVRPERFNRISAAAWATPGIYYDTLELTPEESRELFLALTEDSLKMNLEDVFMADPVLVLSPGFDYDDYDKYRKMHEEFSLGDVMNSIYVFENYENTLAWFEKKYADEGMRHEDRITAAYCYNANGDVDFAWSGDSAYFTDEESIKTLLKSVRRVKSWRMPRNTGEIYIDFELDRSGGSYGPDYNDGWSCEIVDKEAVSELLRNHNENNSPYKG